MRKQLFLLHVIAALFLLAGINTVKSQGVTTAAISGVVVDQTGMGLPGANVLAVHEPSGTRYGAATMADGRFNIVGMRVGGPYKITVTYMGYETQEQDNINLSLGVTSNFHFVLRDAAALLGEVVVTFTRDAIFSSDRTGASTSVGQNELQSLPSFSKQISDFTRLSPMASGNSFAGADNRLNNITVDGSYFNNSFGLAGQPGERTGVAPISMSAIEAITVNIAPYDVRQGHFVGAGINTVTKSGTNQLKGEVYYNFRNSNMVGREALDLSFNPGDFRFNQFGVSIGGPIIKDKLFLFADFGTETLDEPGTTFLANTGAQAVGGNITRVMASDLDQLSNFLRSNFGYETGPYQGYTHQTPARRFIAKVDYNVNQRNNVSFRYNHLDSETDVLASLSSSLGWGNRRSSLDALNFQNSNYMIMENIRSIVGEWNSRLGDNMSNSMIIGYTFQDESRKSRGSMFPMVDILQDGNTYTTFGFEPFTPNNELRYETYQFQNNFSIFRQNHTLTFGVSAEKYYSENIFFPGSQSVYVYNSLDEFYTDAQDHLDNPNRTNSPIELRRFQVRWSNIPGMEKPIQPLNVFYTGIYGQDEWQVNDNFRLTLGLRLDVPFFGKGDHFNEEAAGFVFRDEKGNDVSYSTDKLPDPRIHWSPRIGFNWDVTGDRSTQVRGGSGIFTGTPAYVWISNQIGNNGMMTGFERVENTNDRPFHPNPNHYKPSNVTGAPANQYELAFSDPNFKFPQIWRTNFAIDQKLPWNLIGTLEGIFSQDVNGIYYINANLVDAPSSFFGPDNRPLYAGGGSNRIVSKIDNTVVLKNQNIGYAYNLAASIERPFINGLYAKAAYSYGISRNTIDPGSIAFGSWNNNPHSGNPNNPGLGYSANAAGHRIIGAFSYRTPGSTTFSMFWESRTIGNYSYVFAGDLNRDGGTSNDLIYIPKDKNEMNFFEFHVNANGQVVANPVEGGRTFTIDDQKAAFENFINQDKYLSKNRGKYAERGAVFLPMVHRADFSISHDLLRNISGTRNVLQVRMDIINLGNMLNREWGVGQVAVTNRPLVVRPNNQGGPVDDAGRPIYRMANVGDQLLTKSLQQTLNVGDVYRIQFGVRYIFN
jgi:hypothetical protein